MNNIQSYKKAIIKLADEEVVREYNVQKDAEDIDKIKAVEIELSYRGINI